MYLKVCIIYGGFFYIKGAWAWFYFLLFMYKMVYFLILNNWPKFDTVI